MNAFIHTHHFIPLNILTQRYARVCGLLVRGIFFKKIFFQQVMVDLRKKKLSVPLR